MKKSNIILILGVVIASILIVSWVYNLNTADSPQNTQLLQFNPTSLVSQATISTIIESIIQTTRQLLP